MEKSLLEQLKEARKEYEIAKVCLFNKGETKSDNNHSVKYLYDVNTKSSFKQITRVYTEAVKSYNGAFNYDFDTVNMELLLGLIFDANDFDKDNKLKKGAKPLNDTVRYYTGHIKSYLDGKQTNIADYYEYGVGNQGVVSFKELKSMIDNCGIEYNGPKSFEELKERILSGEVFDITLSANLMEKEDIKEQTKGLRR